MSFDVHAISPKISLNQVIFATEGADYPDCVSGKKVSELLSTHAIAQLVAQNRAELGLDDTPDGDLLPHFLQQLAQNQNDPCHPSNFLALRMGRYLGYLLRVLHEGDAHHCALRPEWDATYWAHWQTIRHVYLAGGLARIPLGGYLRQGAQHILNTSNIPITIHIAPYPDLQPLIGASRLLPADGQISALVLDFGQTATKRAMAYYVDDTLTELQILPKHKAPHASNGAELLHQMFTIIDDTIQRVGDCPAHISMSIATYMHDGGVQQRGQYALMRDWSASPATMIGQMIQQEYHVMPTIRLVHDGTAAALCARGQIHAMTITLGTALGVGFPQTHTRVLPMSSHLEIAIAP